MGLSPSYLSRLPDALISHTLGYVSPVYQWYFQWQHEGITEGAYEAVIELVFKGTPGLLQKTLSLLPKESLREPLALSLLVGHKDLTNLLNTYQIALPPREYQAFDEISRFYHRPPTDRRTFFDNVKKAFLMAIEQGYFHATRFFCIHHQYPTDILLNKGLRGAAIHGNISLIEYLLQKFPSLNRQYLLEGWAYRGNLPKVKECLDQWDPLHPPPTYDWACRWAARGAQRGTLAYLLEHTEEPPLNLELAAAKSGNLEFFLEILPQAIPHNRSYLLFRRLYCYYWRHSRHISSEQVCRLLTHITSTSEQAEQCLEDALSQKDYPLMEFLTSQGINLNNLWCRVICEHNHEGLRWLLDQGADVEEGLFEATACEKPQFMSFFRDMGARNFSQALRYAIVDKQYGIRLEGILRPVNLRRQQIIRGHLIKLLISWGIEDYTPFLKHIIQYDLTLAATCLVCCGFRDYNLGLRLAVQAKKPWWINFFSDLGARDYIDALSGALEKRFGEGVATLLGLGAKLEIAYEILVRRVTEKPLGILLGYLEKHNLHLRWLQRDITTQDLRKELIEGAERVALERYLEDEGEDENK